MADAAAVKPESRMLVDGPQPTTLIDEYAWETEVPDVPDMRGTPTTPRIWKEAVGVAGAIVPWNHPFEVTINKLGQALATGNNGVRA